MDIIGATISGTLVSTMDDVLGATISGALVVTMDVLSNINILGNIPSRLTEEIPEVRVLLSGLFLHA